VKKSVVPVLIVIALATLGGCSGPTTDSEEAIGEASQAVLMPVPIGYWKFDDYCPGNIVPNEEGLWGGDATLYNGAYCSSTAGFFGGANDRAEIPYHPALDFTNVMSVSAWVKADDTNPPQTIVGKWYAPDSYLLWLSNGSYRFSVALAGGGSYSVAAPAPPDITSHVIGVFDGSKLVIYVNGVPGPSASVVGTLKASTRPVTIGNHPSWNAFKGSIDEVQLFDVALAERSIQQKYCGGCSPPSSCCPF
jgi:hypothetical protein